MCYVFLLIKFYFFALLFDCLSVFAVWERDYFMVFAHKRRLIDSSITIPSIDFVVTEGVFLVDCGLPAVAVLLVIVFFRVHLSPLSQILLSNFISLLQSFLSFPLLLPSSSFSTQEFH